MSLPNKELSGLTQSEFKVVLMIAALQFVNITEFMMVMPLGPDYLKDLGIETSRLGIIGGSYSLAGATAGLIGSFFFDRLNRKRAVLTAALGLSIATVLAGFAYSLWTLVAARLVAGFFGGPATSLSFALIADQIAPNKRGRATSIVASAFSIASIVGVPFGLELSRQGGWRLPFFVLGAAIALLVLLGAKVFPSYKPEPAIGVKASDVFKDRNAWLVFFIVGSGMFGSFMMFPNFATFMVFNLGYPRENLGMLYLLGGVFSFFGMMAAGRWVDKRGTSAVVSTSVFGLIAIILLGFMGWVQSPPVPLVFVGFMFFMSLRNVSVTSLSSRVPEASVRARFLSLQNSVQSFSGSLGALISTQILASDPSGTLQGMNKVAWVLISVTAVTPLIMKTLEGRVREKEKQQVWHKESVST